ncbi:MAG: hypothetical protein V3576_05620 [Candidatus Cloacimonadota bacterium]
MSVILDLLGSAMIGALLILMMMTFQLRLRENAERSLYASAMVEHMDEACRKLNSVIALAGIGIAPTSVVTTAATNRMVFITYWDYKLDVLTASSHTVEISLEDSGTDYGDILTITQDGEVLPAPYIFYIEDITFKYYTKLDQLTTTASAVRSAEMLLTFRKDAPRTQAQPLRSMVQIRCYLMNSYMRGA